jgi:hypothetical protein
MHSKSPKCWSGGKRAALQNGGVMETTIFLKVGVAWREYRSKKILAFSLNMTQLIAVEDFNTGFVVQASNLT